MKYFGPRKKQGICDRPCKYSQRFIIAKSDRLEICVKILQHLNKSYVRFTPRNFAFRGPTRKRRRKAVPKLH